MSYIAYLASVFLYSYVPPPVFVSATHDTRTQDLERAMSAAGCSDARLNVNIRGGTHGRDASRWETQRALMESMSADVTTGGSLQQQQQQLLAAPVPEAGSNGSSCISSGGGDALRRSSGSSGAVADLIHPSLRATTASTSPNGGGGSSSSLAPEARYGLMPMNQEQRGRTARASVVAATVPKVSVHHAEPAELLRFVKVALFHKHRVRHFNRGSKLDTWSHRIRVLGTHSSAPPPSAAAAAQNHSSQGGSSSTSSSGSDGRRNEAQRMRGMSSFATSSSSSSRAFGAAKGGAGAGSLREERDLDLPAFPNKQGRWCFLNNK
jgi:hypothetical protein